MAAISGPGSRTAIFKPTHLEGLRADPMRGVGRSQKRSKFDEEKSAWLKRSLSSRFLFLHGETELRVCCVLFVHGCVCEYVPLVTCRLTHDVTTAIGNYCGDPDEVARYQRDAAACLQSFSDEAPKFHWRNNRWQDAFHRLFGAHAMGHDDDSESESEDEGDIETEDVLDFTQTHEKTTALPEPAAPVDLHGVEFQEQPEKRTASGRLKKKSQWQRIVANRKERSTGRLCEFEVGDDVLVKVTGQFVVDHTSQTLCQALEGEDFPFWIGHVHAVQAKKENVRIKYWTNSRIDGPYKKPKGRVAVFDVGFARIHAVVRIRRGDGYPTQTSKKTIAELTRDW